MPLGPHKTSSYARLYLHRGTRETRSRGFPIELSTRYLSTADDIIRISFLSWDISSRDMLRSPRPPDANTSNLERAGARPKYFIPFVNPRHFHVADSVVFHCGVR